MKNAANIIVLLIVMALASCNGRSGTEDTAQNVRQDISFNNDLDRFGNEEGFRGVFNIDEMLTLARLDSAPMKDVAYRVAQAYSVLEADLRAIDATTDGPPGQISYNSDTANFKFECLLLIDRMPSTEPSNSKVVLLEAGNMLVYNHYGSYQSLHKSYNHIAEICRSKTLRQVGAMREFYITDPTVEPDPDKWITRILVPVSMR